jgi:hypothetical protein
MKTQTIVKFKIRVLTLLFLITSAGLKAQQITNFAGAWVRNTEKCDVGDHFVINTVPIRVVISQDAKQIEIKRVQIHGQSDTAAYTEKIKFDGPAGNSIVRQNLNKSSTGAWSGDHKQFIETANYTDDQGNPMQKVKETWTLSEDGKILTFQIVLVVGDMDYELTEVFDKN